MTALRLPLAPGPATDGGRAIVRLTPSDMERAALRPGDIVALRGMRCTHARLLPSQSSNSAVCTDGITAANAGASWGEVVSLSKAELPALNAIRLKAPATYEIKSFAPALQDMSLSVGDRHILYPEPISAGITPQPIDVTVEDLDPPGAGRVGPATQIVITAPEPAHPDYPGVAGLARQIAAIHEMVELPLERPDLFERLGLAPPRGVLFTGPPGSGKTLLARALAERTASAFFQIAGPEIVSKHYGETERALRDVFTAAAKKGPAIVFIDEIDAIAPQRDALSGEKQVERRVVGQLLTLMDGLAPRDRLVVIAATNLPDTLDPALRRPGRFEREIAFTAPDTDARREILALHLADAPLSQDVDLLSVAQQSSGYLGADLAALAREAGLAALDRARRDAGGSDHISAADLFLTKDDLDSAIARTRPSLLRADAFDATPPGWTDVGGLEDTKAALTEAVIWPLRHREAFTSLGLTPPRGILLSGQPGTGKTLLARALATEAGMNFVPVQTSSILSQYLGEAERAVEAVFRRARLVSPCLLFFDELDTLTLARGEADAATDRVIAQILTEIDGLQPNAGITVIGATNRPERIDPALLRAGRFDLAIRMELPEQASRADILAIHTRGRSLDGTVDLDAVALATQGATPADLASIVATAARKALVRWRSGGGQSAPAIQQVDLENAVQDWATRSTRLCGSDAPRAAPAGGTTAPQTQAQPK